MIGLRDALRQAVLKRARRHLKHEHPAGHVQAFRRLKDRGVRIETVIDVGASDGRWSRRFAQAYPDARYLLVEAQNHHLDGLKAYAAEAPNVEFVLAAAGAAPGSTFFDASDPLGGVALDEAVSEDGRVVVEVPVTTLDAEVRERGLRGPFLVKLDTHGHEVPILEGAANVLDEAAAVIIEVYNFRIQPKALRFHEMVDFMACRGFSVADAFDPLWRPRDGMLWQMDMLFMKSDRPEFGRDTYA